MIIHFEGAEGDMIATARFFLMTLLLYKQVPAVL